MALTRFLLSAVAATSLAACATTNDRLDTAELTELFVTDFTSTDPRGCTTADVDLTHSEALAFFQQARQMSAKQLGDHYPFAPCKVDGTLKRAGQACDFEISAARTGRIECDARSWYFACDDCAELFE